jgi:hypothetical protein
MFHLHAHGRAAAMSALALTAALLFSPSSHAAGKAHDHGHATLDVVVEPQRLSLQFSSPLDNLLGFERAPRSDKERQQADAAVARLKAAEALFKIDPAAQCKLAKVELTSAALKLGVPPAEKAPTDHADVDASFDFTCADATKARHIDVGLFDFKRLHRVDVQVAGPAGQFKRTLKPAASRLSLAQSLTR